MAQHARARVTLDLESVLTLHGYNPEIDPTLSEMDEMGRQHFERKLREFFGANGGAIVTINSLTVKHDVVSLEQAAA